MPCIATLAYGYAFNMGFMNYYLSLGFGAFVSRARLAGHRVGREGSRLDRRRVTPHSGVARSPDRLPLGAHHHRLRRAAQPPRWAGRKLAVPGGAVAGAARAFAGISTTASNSPPTGTAACRSGNPMAPTSSWSTATATKRWRGSLSRSASSACSSRSLRNLRNIFWWKDLALPVELYLARLLRGRDLPRKFPRLHVRRLDRPARLAPYRHLRHSSASPSSARAQLRQWTIAGFVTIGTAYFVFLALDTRKPQRSRSQRRSRRRHATGRNAHHPHASRRPQLARRIRLPRRRPRLHPPLLCLLQLRALLAPVPRPSQKTAATFSSPTPPKTPTTCKAAATKSNATTSPSNSSTSATRADWTKLCLHDLKEGESTGHSAIPATSNPVGREAAAVGSVWESPSAICCASPGVNVMSKSC